MAKHERESRILYCNKRRRKKNTANSIPRPFAGRRRGRQCKEFLARNVLVRRPAAGSAVCPRARLLTIDGIVVTMSTELLAVGVLGSVSFMTVRIARLLPLLVHAPDGGAPMFADAPLPYARLDDYAPGAAVVHEITFACFAFAFLFDLLTGVVNGWNDVLRRRLSILMCSINLSSSLNYFGILSGAAPLLTDFNNRVWIASRPLHWCFTASLMLWMMGNMARISFRRITVAIAIQIVCIACGFCFLYTWRPWAWLAFVTAYSLFLLVAYHIWTFLGEAKQNTMFADDERVLMRVRIASMVTWFMFGIALVSGRLELISPYVEEVLLSFADFSTKAVLSLALFQLNLISQERIELVLMLIKENLIVDPHSLVLHV